MFIAGILLGFFGLLGIETVSFGIMVYLTDKKHEPPTKEEWKQYW